MQRQQRLDGTNGATQRDQGVAQPTTGVVGSPWARTRTIALASALVLTAALPGCKGCQKEPPAPTAEPPSTLKEPGAVDSPAAATAADAPAAASAVDAPAEVTPAHYSIAPTFESELPLKAGKVAKLVLTPTADKTLVEAFDPVLGQDLILLVARPGHDWVQTVGVPAGKSKSSSFPVEFTPPSMGNYSLVCIFKPKGQPVVVEQITVSASGDVKVEPLPLSNDLEYAGDGDLKVAMRLSVDPLIARSQVTIGTLWNQAGQPLGLTAMPNLPGAAKDVVPKVMYFVVDVAEPRVEVPFPLVDPPPIGEGAAAVRSDSGTLASFTFQRPGQYLIAAIAAADKEPGKLLTATFAVSAGEAGPPPAP